MGQVALLHALDLSWNPPKSGLCHARVFFSMGWLKDFKLPKNSAAMSQICNMTMATYGMPTPNGPNLNYKFFGGPCGEFSWFKLWFLLRVLLLFRVWDVR